MTLTLPGFSVAVDDASFTINTASGQYLPAPATPTGTEPAPLPVPELAVALNWANATGDGGLAVDTDGDGAADLVDPGELLALTDLAITHHVQSVAISGHLEGDLFEFLHISARFAYGKSSVAVDLDPDDADDTANPESAELITFGMTLDGAPGDPGLVIGDPEGVHFAIESGALVVAIVRAGGTGEDRVWTAISASLAGAELAGLDGFDVVVTTFAVELNRFAGTGAAALDWTTMLNLDGDDTFGDEVRDRVEVLGTTIDFTEARLRASGRLDIVNIADILSGTVAFAFEQQEVDVQTASGDLTGATLTTFALLVLADDGDDANGTELGLRIGAAEGVHFTVESGALLYASIKPAAGTLGDTRVFTAITASLANAELQGIDGLTARIVSLTVEVNQAAGARGATDATALDWTTDVALDGDYEAPVFEVPTGGEPVELTLAYTGPLLGASGRFVINLFDFVSGDVDFTYSSTTEDVVLSASETLTDAQITRLSLRVHTLFVGVPDGPGFTITGGTLILATVKPAKAATATDQRSWIALTATLESGEFQGIPDVELAFSDAVLEINRASGVNGAVEAEALDWTTAFVDGNGDPVEFEVVDLDGDAHVIGFDDEAFHLEATATFDAFGFVVGTVKVTVRQETVDADLDGEGTADLTGAQLLTIAIEINPAHTPDGNLFIGVNGVGFSLDSGTLFVATLKAKPAAPGATTPADPRTWTAIAANLTGAQLVGLPEDFVFVADTIQLKINQAAGGATPPDPLDWGAALDIDGDGVFGEDAEDDDPQDALIRGEGVDEVEIDFAGRILLVAGAVRIRIADFVYVAGQFALEKGDPILVTPVGSATQVEVTLLRVGVSEANVFVGMGVPDSNGDGIFDGTDDLSAVDSIGIALTDTSLAIALMRQTPATPGGTPGPLSFTALKVTSTATLLGVPAVSLQRDDHRPGQHGQGRDGRHGAARGRLHQARRRRAHDPHRPGSRRPRPGALDRPRLRVPAAAGRRHGDADDLGVRLHHRRLRVPHERRARHRHDRGRPHRRRDRDDHRRLQRLRLLRHGRPVLGHRRRRQGHRPRRAERRRRHRPGDLRRVGRARAAQARRRGRRGGPRRLQGVHGPQGARHRAADRRRRRHGEPAQPPARAQHRGADPAGHAAADARAAARRARPLRHAAHGRRRPAGRRGRGAHDRAGLRGPAAARIGLGRADLRRLRRRLGQLRLRAGRGPPGPGARQRRDGRPRRDEDRRVRRLRLPRDRRPVLDRLRHRRRHRRGRRGRRRGRDRPRPGRRRRRDRAAQADRRRRRRARSSPSRRTPTRSRWSGSTA